MTSFQEMVESAVQDRTESLHNIGRTLFENPELNYEERIAHDLITGILEQEEFRVERHYILETAFRAEFGSRWTFLSLEKHWGLTHNKH